MGVEGQILKKAVMMFMFNLFIITVIIIIRIYIGIFAYHTIFPRSKPDGTTLKQYKLNIIDLK